jgi:hypothetical protein
MAALASPDRAAVRRAARDRFSACEIRLEEAVVVAIVPNCG